MKGMYYFLTVALLCPGVLAYAQNDPKPENWTGELVVGKKPASEIQFGRTIDGKVVNYEFRGIYPQRVREDKDGWLRLFDGYQEGWAKKEEFLLSRDALSYFTDRINSNEKDAFAWLMRGTAWLDRREYDNAIKDFTERIRLNPIDAIAYNSRGLAWYGKKDYDKGIFDYDEAIRLDPKYTLPYSNRGLACIAKREYDKAIADCDAAIRLDAKYTRAFYNRGNAWFGKKEYDKAIADYDEVIRLDPKYAIVYCDRANAWSSKKEYSKAIADCDEAIRLDPKYVLAFNNRGWYYYLKKDYDKALADLEACLKLDPKDVYATSNRGLVYAAQKKYAQAAEAFEASLGLNDTNYSYYEYGEFLSSCPEAKYRDGKKAVVLAKRSLDMQGKEAGWEVHAALAAAYAEVGDFELAVTSQRTVLDDKTCTGDDRKAQETRLELYRAKKPYRMEK